MLEIEEKQFFLFEKQRIPRLAMVLGIPDKINTSTNISLLCIHDLCILLRRLAYPNSKIDVLDFLIIPMLLFLPLLTLCRPNNN